MNNNKWIKTSKWLNVCRTMPPLKHKPEEEFEVTKSEIINWLSSHPEIMMYVFEIISGRDKKREQLITYDKGQKTWSGVDYHD